MEPEAESPERGPTIGKVLICFFLGGLLAFVIFAPRTRTVGYAAERSLGPEHPFVKYLKEDRETRSLSRLMLAYSFYYARMHMPHEPEAAASAKRIEELYSDPDKYREYMDMWKCMDEYFERGGCPNPLSESSP